MSFTPAPVLPSGPANTGGLSCFLRITKRGAVFTLFMAAHIQERLFGGSIIGRSFVMAIGRGSDEGKVQLVMLDDNEVIDGHTFVAAKGIKAGATLKCGAWDLLPKDKRQGTPVEIEHFDGKKAVLLLPSWARPSRSGGAMEAEFGLKPVPRAPEKPPVAAPAASGSRFAEQAAAMGRAAK